MAAGARRLIVKSLWSKSAMRLRVAEVSKVADIDSAHMLLRVERGKGGQYRDALLSADLLSLLR